LNASLTSVVAPGFPEFIHFHWHIRKNNIADLRNFEKSIDHMEGKMDTTVGSMSNVRDVVIRITAKGGKSAVPPARRPAAKPAS
jgi:hypothetical protein